MKLLREAYDATMKDKVFSEEAAKHAMMIRPQTGAEIEALIRQAAATPKPVLERYRAKCWVGEVGRRRSSWRVRRAKSPASGQRPAQTLRAILPTPSLRCVGMRALPANH